MNLAGWLNAWSEAWAAYMVSALVDSSVLLVGLLLVWLPLRRRISAQLSHGLFLLVLLKLMLPVSLAGSAWTPARSLQGAVTTLSAWLSPGAEAPHGGAQAVAPAPAAAPEFPTTGDIGITTADLPLSRPQPAAPLPPKERRVAAAPQPAPPGGRALLSIGAALMLAWGAVSLLLLARLAWALWSTHALIRQADPLAPWCLPVDLDALRRAAGIRGRVRWATDARLQSPAVGGLFRPTVVLPPDLDDDLTPKQLSWVLLHELAHIRRLDLWVVLFQRVLQALFFFHPAVHVANAVIDQLREYACDDAALAAGQTSRRDCGEGFLVIVGRHVEQSVPLSPSLGLFESQTLIHRRLVRILDPRRPVNGRLSLRSALGLLLISLLVLPTSWGRDAAARLSLPGGPRPGSVVTVPAAGADRENEPTNYRPGAVLFRRNVTPAPADAAGDAAAAPALGGRNGVLALAYSPDGKRLATVGEDALVNLRDLETGAIRARLEGHRDTVACLAYAPDGRTIATAGYDRTVRIWDSATGRQLLMLQGHSSWVVAVAFAPDGKVVASAGYDKTVRLWDAATGRALGVLAGHTSSVRCLAFAPGGTWLASAGADRAALVWDWRRQALRFRCNGHTGTIRAVGFAPDGGTLVTAGEDGEIRLWEAASGRERATLTGHSDMVSGLAYSPSGRTLATASLDATVKLWDLPTLRERATLQGHTDGLSSLAFAPGGRQLATGSYDGSVRLWEPAAPVFAATACFAAPDGAEGVAFAADGSTVLALRQDETLARWDARTGASLPRDAGGGAASRVAVPARTPRARGQVLAIAGEEGSVRVVDAATRAERFVLRTEGYQSCAVSPDHRVLATGHHDGDILLWDTRNGRQLASLKGHTHPVEAISFAPDSRSLATLDNHHALKLWSLETHRLTPHATLKGDSPFCLGTLAYSPDGATLAVGDGPANEPGAVTLWDLASRRIRGTLEGHERGVAALAFAPDGRTIASADWSGVIRLWDAATGHPRDVFEGPGRVSRLAFAPDGTMLAAAGMDRSIQVWEVNSCVELARFSGSRWATYSLAFSPDGRWLASGGGMADGHANAFGEVTIWDVAGRTRAASLEGHPRAVVALSFSADGATLATSGLDATVRIWDWNRSTGQSRPRLVLGGLPCWAQSLAFSPDGRLLALGGRGDAIVTLHDTASGTELSRLVGHCGVVRDLAFAPDGRSLATVGSDRAIKLWELPLSRPSASSPSGR